MAGTKNIPEKANTPAQIKNRICGYFIDHWHKFKNGDDTGEKYTLTVWIMMRLCGLMFLSAFISFGVQASALIGEHGILPLEEFMQALRTHVGERAPFLYPMVFWFNASDLAIQMVCWLGGAFSLLFIMNIIPRISLIFIYALYLSLTYAGQQFMSFQWDFYLIEIAFLSFILLCSTKVGIVLFRWLVFRFMFVSGLVKIASGDIAWRNMTALNYHFETQPLPTTLAWYADKLPDSILMLGTGATLIIELVVPFLIFMPRKFRIFAGICIIGFETVILLTGNYNFFNLLTIFICLSLFDDEIVKKFMPQKILAWLGTRIKGVEPHKVVKYIISFVAIWTIAASLVQLYTKSTRRLPGMIAGINTSLTPLRVVNTYGPFAVMTKKRPEIIIEGSNDGQNWQAYEFKYKPGDLGRAPFFNIPHQPRLDWQLWFAALDIYPRHPWFARFVERLLEGQPNVLAQMAYNPFPDKPPVFIRAQLYDYKFTTFEESYETGKWWKRTYTSSYFPSARLK